ncbi:hypothetical protein HMPREF0201_01147 [Cedecea davisae DSM 4568]|uniref:Uncharacterized protein n=1 Tax=Cedecea davisae DSM 4568 TaxID=566551 RepID=S3IXW6_9ENTR|nr:hypothetical protein HMPREF0201_01147 [Cedecea davisae DSM 4568]
MPVNYSIINGHELAGLSFINDFALLLNVSHSFVFFIIFFLDVILLR